MYEINMFVILNPAKSISLIHSAVGQIKEPDIQYPVKLKGRIAIIQSSLKTRCQVIVRVHEIMMSGSKNISYSGSGQV